MEGIDWSRLLWPYFKAVIFVGGIVVCFGAAAFLAFMKLVWECTKRGRR